MKLILSALAASALAFAWMPSQAATTTPHKPVHHHYVHVVHHHVHHHYHYYAGGPYAAPPPPPPGYGYYPAPYPPGAYAPGYFYFAPGDYLGNRTVFKALIDSEWDPPFSGR
jgi:hypothetical protein